jgi:glycerol-3-phosphate O-acyltransferase
MICVYYRLRFVTILLKNVVQTRAVRQCLLSGVKQTSSETVATSVNWLQAAEHISHENRDFAAKICCHSDLGWAASPMRPDVIFEDDRALHAFFVLKTSSATILFGSRCNVLNKLLTGQDQSNAGQLKQRINHKIKRMSRDQYARLRTDVDEQPSLVQPYRIGTHCHHV